MSKEHTPGPYLVEREDNDIWRIYSEDYGTITRLHRPTGMEHVQPDELMEATARIMAIGPELLEVLKQAFEHSCKRSESHSRWFLRDQDNHERIKNVIAKAKGEV